MLCTSRRPSNPCDVSVTSNCGFSASASADALFISRPQIWNPCDVVGDGLKYDDTEPSFEIRIVGTIETEVDPWL